jgi:PTH1 family peptidyl-tRNA hydrolase
VPGVKLVIGLGNPGKTYADTRHNVGWMALDRLADRAGLAGRARERDAASSVRGQVAGLDVVLAKPLTYMNESGIAVRKLLARHRVPLEDVLVVVDDFALPFGKLRVRPSGTAGGHNGLASIIAELGSRGFARLRIGIGEPRRNAIDHVLSRFAADERKRLPALLDAAADAIADWAREGAPAAANRWNAWSLEGTTTERASVPAEKGPPGGPVGAAGARPAVSGAPGEEPAGEAAAGEPRAAGPGEVGGPPGPDGIRRTRTGWRRVLGRG